MSDVGRQYIHNGRQVIRRTVRNCRPTGEVRCRTEFGATWTSHEWEGEIRDGGVAFRVTAWTFSDTLPPFPTWNLDEDQP